MEMRYASGVRKDLWCCCCVLNNVKRRASLSAAARVKPERETKMDTIAWRQLDEGQDASARELPTGWPIVEEATVGGNGCEGSVIRRACIWRHQKDRLSLEGSKH